MEESTLRLVPQKIAVSVLVLNLLAAGATLAWQEIPPRGDVRKRKNAI